MMYLRPSCGKKLNEGMYSPMQIAVQNEHKKVVLALLEANKDLVRVRGKKGHTALHYAAEKGETELIAQFLQDCPECIEDVKVHTETALHVAAQNGKLEALEILARFLQRRHIYSHTHLSKRRILDSCKDRDGNTVLHIAASKAQPQMVKLLLECGSAKIIKETNEAGFTALHILEMQSSQTPEKEKCLAYMRRAEGSIIMLGLNYVMETKRDIGSLITGNYTPSKFERETLKEKLRFKVTIYEQIVMHLTVRMANLTADQINAVLVVLALILTASYQVLLNPPGGVWQGNFSANRTLVEASHVGQSVMDGFSFEVLYWLNFEVFITTSFFTVVFIQIMCKTNGTALLAELLLSTLMWCILVARLVVQPTVNPSAPSRGQAAAYIWFINLVLLMEVSRWITIIVVNPTTVRFFRNFFYQMSL